MPMKGSRLTTDHLRDRWRVSGYSQSANVIGRPFRGSFWTLQRRPKSHKVKPHDRMNPAYLFTVFSSVHPSITQLHIAVLSFQHRKWVSLVFIAGQKRDLKIISVIRPLIKGRLVNGRLIKDDWSKDNWSSGRLVNGRLVNGRFVNERFVKRTAHQERTVDQNNRLLTNQWDCWITVSVNRRRCKMFVYPA